MNMTISNQKRAIRATESRIKNLLKNRPKLKARFSEILAKHKRPLLGEFTRNPPSFLGAESDTEKSWFDSDFAMDLFDFGKTAVLLEQVNSAEQKVLDKELAKIKEQNAALDRQIKLRSSGAMAYGGSFMDELFNSPVKIVAIVGLVGALFYMRKK